MRTYNHYILLITFVLLLTTVILTAIGQYSLDVYYLAYIIEALVITELYIYFNAKARQGLSLVSTGLFVGFMFIVILEIIKIAAIRY